MRSRYISLLALAVAVVLVSAACSVRSVQDESPVLPGQSTSEDEGGSKTAGDNEVDVTLTDFGIELSQQDFEAGKEYTFTVVNEGVVAHEFMLLPPIEGEPPSMEVLDEMAVLVFTAEELTPGATVTKTVTFPVLGDEVLEAACHVPGHYEAGMKAPITVSG